MPLACIVCKKHSDNTHLYAVYLFKLVDFRQALNLWWTL